MTTLTYDELRSNAQKIADERLKERILRGIDLLNEKYGPDWVDKIDPATLALESPTHCVLGQVYEDVPTDKTASDAGYWRGLAILNGEVEDEPSLFGFNVALDEASEEEQDDDDFSRPHYAVLTRAWRTVFGESD